MPYLAQQKTHQHQICPLCALPQRLRLGTHALTCFAMQKKLLLPILFVFFASSRLLAQVDPAFRDLSKIVEEGKTYAINKAAKGNANAREEKTGYYIRLVPPKYQTINDTIIISPALNGNLDTSNYFIQTEVLVLREPGAEWKTAKVSRLCMKDASKPPHAAICLLRTAPKYEMINHRFYPFKNILDTSNTDNVIPAQIKIVQREELIQPARLEKVDLSENIADSDHVIKISAGSWTEWEEVVCEFGVFNDPDIRSVQEKLQKNGYKLDITNQYDEQTKSALHQFQLDNMLPVGEFDDATLRRLGLERQKLIQIED